jgi:hypothetical protein
MDEPVYWLIGVVVAGVVGYAGLLARRWLLAHIGQKRFSLAVEIARQAVLAVEQKYGPGAGEMKKGAAVAIAEEWLLKNGITLDVQRIADLIEAAVFDELNRWREAAAEPGSVSADQPARMLG